MTFVTSYYLQVASFFSKDLSVACISGDTTDDAIIKGVSMGAYQLVYFTPEMIITNKKWRRVIEGDVYTERLKAFVVDESHRVKKW